MTHKLYYTLLEVYQPLIQSNDLLIGFDYCSHITVSELGRKTDESIDDEVNLATTSGTA